MRTQLRGLLNRERELLRHNNVKRLEVLTTAGQRLRATEPVAALLIGESDRGPKRETIRGGYHLCQAQLGFPYLKGAGPPNQNSHLNKYARPTRTPPLRSTNNKIPATTASLNFR